jgi:solute:Na+ symporter, SSS family
LPAPSWFSSSLAFLSRGPSTITGDFFLARRRVPWWAACLSFLATEISAVTIISVPATAYSENWEYAQFFVGSSLAKLAVAFLFIPAFYRHNVTTILVVAGDRRDGGDDRPVVAPDGAQPPLTTARAIDVSIRSS